MTGVSGGSFEHAQIALPTMTARFSPDVINFVGLFLEYDRRCPVIQV